MWKTIIEDTVWIDPEKKSVSFFGNEHSKNGPSINTLPEQEIVKIIIQKKNWQALLCSELRVPDQSLVMVNVKRQEFLNNNESGDFDLLFVENGDPEKISIVEFKKIKVTSIDSEKDKVNRLNDINTLIGQGKERLNLGFHKVSIAIIIQADLRERKSKNIITKDIARNASELIYKEIVKAREIDERIGIIYIKFYQPTGKDFKRRKSFSIWVDRYPTEQNQKSSITIGARRVLAR